MNTAISIVSGTSDKLAMIVGPCSVHNIDSALVYAKRLRALQSHLHHLFLVMRVYVEKPRSCLGWKGLLYDPFLNGTNNLDAGLRLARELFETIHAMDVPIATEFVNPFIAPYFQEFISWGFIGARTAASQVHRELASSLPFPVGFKNLLNGDLHLPLQSILSAQSPHAYFGPNATPCYSQGNPYTHLVLRGSTTQANYTDVEKAYALQMSYGISTRILVDCAHGNTQKDPYKQRDVAIAVAGQITPRLGLMLESFLEEGNTAVEHATPNLSITDPCLSWDATEELLFHIDAIKSAQVAEDRKKQPVLSACR